MHNDHETDTELSLDDAGVDAASSGEPAVSDQAQNSGVESLTLDEIQAALGKKFESKDKALKAIRDTFSYVGKKQDDATTAAERKLAESGNYVLRSEIETEFFYRDNKEASAHRTLVDAVAKANGISARDAAQLPDVKKVIEAATAYEAQEAAKTVMQSSSRLGASRDRLNEARTLIAQGRKEEGTAAAVAAAYEGL